MKPFQTSDRGLSAYLLSEGMELLGTVPTADPKRFNFVFLDRDDRTPMVELYMTGQATVSAKQFDRCIKQVTKALNSPFNPDKQESGDETT